MRGDPFAVRLVWPVDEEPDTGPADVAPLSLDGAAGDEPSDAGAVLRALAASLDALGRSAASGQAALSGRLADLATAVRELSASSADGLEAVRGQLAAFGEELRSLREGATSLAARVHALEEEVGALGAVVPLVEALAADVRSLRRRIPSAAPRRRSAD